jgi:hypothetical protein
MFAKFEYLVQKDRNRKDFSPKLTLFNFEFIILHLLPQVATNSSLIEKRFCQQEVRNICILGTDRKTHASWRIMCPIKFEFKQGKTKSATRKLAPRLFPSPLAVRKCHMHISWHLLLDDGAPISRSAL